jgi:hypothetical protein
MSNYKIQINSHDDITVGSVDGSHIITIYRGEKNKIGMSATLPVDIKKAKAILFAMQKTIEIVESVLFDSKQSFEIIFDGEIGLPITAANEWGRRDRPEKVSSGGIL